MAGQNSLFLLGRGCSSSSFLITGAIGSVPSSFLNRLSSSRFLPFSAYSPGPETPHKSPPAADRNPEISFPEDPPFDCIKVYRGEECMYLTRKTKDEMNVKTHIMHDEHDAEQDDYSNFRDAAFIWFGDIDDEIVVVDDKIVFVGKRKGEGEGGGGGGGGGGGDGDGDVYDYGYDDGYDHWRSIWMSLKGFFKK